MGDGRSAGKRGQGSKERGWEGGDGFKRKSRMREVIKQREKREDRDEAGGASLKAECAEGVYKRTQSSAF